MNNRLPIAGGFVDSFNIADRVYFQFKIFISFLLVNIYIPKYIFIFS